MASNLMARARAAQARVDAAAARAAAGLGPTSTSRWIAPKAGQPRPVKKRAKKYDDKPKSWKYDEDNPELIVPVPAFTEPGKGGADLGAYRDLKFEKRKRDFEEEREKQIEFAKSKQKAREDALAFDDRQALLGEEKPEEPRDLPVVERDFGEDAIRFDYATGKVRILRPLKPRFFVDYNIFRPDDTIVLNGKRRTGKSFLMRKILYEMRHCFEAGLVFTATKHNGFWQQMVPDKYIHDTLNITAIDRMLKMRAKVVAQNQLRFGPEYRDDLYYFIVLDDMVRARSFFSTHAVVDTGAAVAHEVGDLSLLLLISFLLLLHRSIKRQDITRYGHVRRQHVDLLDV